MSYGRLNSFEYNSVGKFTLIKASVVNVSVKEIRGASRPL
jgi:hypothetical protein